MGRSAVESFRAADWTKITAVSRRAPTYDLTGINFVALDLLVAAHGISTSCNKNTYPVKGLPSGGKVWVNGVNVNGVDVSGVISGHLNVNCARRIGPI